MPCPVQDLMPELHGQLTRSHLAVMTSSARHAFRQLSHALRPLHDAAVVVHDELRLGAASHAPRDDRQGLLAVRLSGTGVTVGVVHIQAMTMLQGWVTREQGAY